MQTQAQWGCRGIQDSRCRPQQKTQRLTLLGDQVQATRGLSAQMSLSEHEREK
jgi:hypothetical protein